MKRLIVNADDLGWSDAVTRGIIRAHREGLVTSTTLMVNLPGAAGALELARREAPRLAVGIHLNLTEGEPMAPRADVAAILDSRGRLPRSLPSLFRRLSSSREVRRAAERELDSQLTRAREIGLAPSHADSHKHVHVYPALLPIVVELARRHGIPAVRATAEIGFSGLTRLLPREWSLAARLRQRVQAGAARRWGLAAQRALRDAGLATTDWFFGVRATGGVSAELIARLLAAAPEGTGELMVHPGLPDDSSEWPTRLGRSRPAELAAVCDPEARRALESGGWTLVTFKEVSDGRQQSG